MRTCSLLATLLVAIISAPASAQFKEPAGAAKGPKLDRELRQKLRVGVSVTASGGTCKGIVATIPVPTDWPEQAVQILEQEISPTVGSVKYSLVGGTVKQMRIEIPVLPIGQEARAVITFEVSRRVLLPPEKTDILAIPKKVERENLIYLGPSPFIESRHAKITALAKEITADKANAWQEVEAIYDWVRDHVAYQNGELKGALKALNDKTGDCEELSSLFIAICRAHKIPARTVWVPEHCYPEFYLVDDDGHGHWFPCQAAGTRSFGGIAEQRPILQKGDNFKDPERPRERLRYVNEHLTGSGGGKPRVNFIREVVGN